MRDMKKESSSWAKQHFDQKFEWQEGYAAFTVSPASTGAVKTYIENQEQHHKKITFVDELQECLKNAGIEYNEKYLL